MAWNEPGNNNKDPWGKRPEQGPPDLDEVLRKLQKQLSGLLGGNKNRSGSSGGEGFSGFLLVIILVLASIVWALSGFFIVKEAEQAVVLRLGKFHQTLNPGLHWVPRFVDSYRIVDVNQIHDFKISGLMLTQDENIVELNLSVQYRIIDPLKYLYSVANADKSLQQATESALRHVVGSATMDDVRTRGKELARRETWQRIENIIKTYDMGLVVSDVTLQDVRPPTAVQKDFDDAIKAREDEERFINEANAYQLRREQISKGAAQRVLEEAKAYKESAILKAEGAVAQFEKLLPEYEAAPEVTRKRLYLEAMQEVMSNTNKVLVDKGASNSLIYLPLDKLGQATTKRTTLDTSSQSSDDSFEPSADSSSFSGFGNNSHDGQRSSARTTGR